MLPRARVWVAAIVLVGLVAPAGTMTHGLAGGFATHSLVPGPSERTTPGPRGAPTTGGPLPIATAPEGPSATGSGASASPCTSLTPSGSARGFDPLDVAAPGANASTPVTGDANAFAGLRSAESAGACTSTLFPPRAGASPAQLASVVTSGVVQPLYNSTPAPTGLGYFGVSVLPNGSRVATVLDSTSLRGQADINATGIQPLDLYNSEVGPDAYALQLNAVLTRVTVFGHPGYEFWTQNVFEYFPPPDRRS